MDSDTDTKTKTKANLQLLWDVTAVIVASVLSAFGLYVFVYPANFAPSGVDGVATMLQKLTGISAAIYTIIINLPLLIWAIFKLNKKYVLWTVVFTVLSSGLIFLLQKCNFPTYNASTDKILPAIFAGIILGVRTGIMIKIGSSTGGIDIIACMIQQKKPHVNIEKYISVICYFIICISYFVYKDDYGDNALTCILLSVIQTFVLEKTISYTLKDNRNAIEVKIITKSPDILKEKILFDLKHGATVMECTGMYTGEGRFMVVTIINVRQLGELTNIIKELPDTFIYYSDVTGIKGNFRWKKTDIPH